MKNFLNSLFSHSKLSPEDYYKSGKNKIEQNNYRGAIEDFSKGIELLQIQNKNEVQKHSNSSESWKTMVSDLVNGNLGPFFTMRAFAKEKLGDYNGAAQDQLANTKLFPFIAHGFHNLGELKIRMGNYNEAIEAFTKTIELTEKAQDSNGLITGFEAIDLTYMGRGFAKNEIKDFAGAILDYTVALEISPDWIQGYNQRARCYMAIGEKDKNENNFTNAINDFNVIIDNKPDGYLYCNRGRCKLMLQDYHGAYIDLTKSITLKPNDFLPYFFRGLVYVNLNNNKETISDFTKVSKNYKVAISDFTKVIELDPKYGEAYLHRGLCKRCLNDSEGANLDLTKAEALGQSLPPGGIKGSMVITVYEATYYLPKE